MTHTHTPIVRTYATREEWLAGRTGIGSSEAASALGVPGAYSTPYAVWSEKTGRAPREHEDSVPEYIQAGQFLEPGIANWYERRSGRTVYSLEEWAVGWELIPFTPHKRIVSLKHPELPWCQSTPDRVQLDLGRGSDPGVLELKNTGGYMADEWLDGDIPMRHQIQVQHQLLVTGLDWGTIAAVIGGNKLVWQDVERNESFIAAMVAELTRFWALVESETPPEIGGEDQTWQAVRRSWREDDGGEVETGGELIAAYNDASARAKAAERDAREAKANLCAALGEAAYATMDGKRVASWKQTKAGTRVFRVLKAGQEVK